MPTNQLLLSDRNPYCALCTPLAQVNTLTAANIYRPLGIDNSWDLEEFKQNFSIKITKMVDDMMEFEMMGKEADAATHVGGVDVQPFVGKEELSVASDRMSKLCLRWYSGCGQCRLVVDPSQSLSAEKLPH